MREKKCVSERLVDCDLACRGRAHHRFPNAWSLYIRNGIAREHRKRERKHVRRSPATFSRWAARFPEFGLPRARSRWCWSNAPSFEDARFGFNQTRSIGRVTHTPIPRTRNNSRISAESNTTKGCKTRSAVGGTRVQRDHRAEWSDTAMAQTVVLPTASFTAASQNSKSRRILTNIPGMGKETSEKRASLRRALH